MVRLSGWQAVPAGVEAVAVGLMVGGERVELPTRGV